jgi:predicted O-methyltransferase YrrM
MEDIKKLFTWPAVKPDVLENDHNWFDIPNIIVLSSIIKKINPKYILELGSWTGAGSTKYILNESPDSYVVCVDHWSKDYNDYVQKEYGIEKVKNELGDIIPTLWETFLVNMWDYQNRLIPIKAKTIDGLKTLSSLNIPFDLIYIDAHHDYENVLQDIKTINKLWPNAFIVGDDYTWEGVKKAVHEFANANDLKVIVEDNCWFYIKNK